MLTAGHSLNNASDCANTRFVFKFYRTSASTMEVITTQDSFSCQGIVVRQLGTTADGRNLDCAIARLDRPAAPRFACQPPSRSTFPDCRWSSLESLSMRNLPRPASSNVQRLQTVASW